MAHWLFKSEPSSWSFAQQVEAGAKGTFWNGVRNHQAKLNLMAMKVGDEGFFYHSNEGQGGRRHRRDHQALLSRSQRRDGQVRHGRHPRRPPLPHEVTLGGDQG